MATTEFGIVYAIHIITVQFGFVVSKVCECLLRRGPLSSRDISRLAESDINHNQVKDILYLLIQHNCVQAFSVEPPDGSESKAIVQYIALFNNIIHRVRYNKSSSVPHVSFRIQDTEMEERSELKQKIYEIFKGFMTGIIKLEELGNAAKSFLLRFQQGLSLLKRPPIVTSSKLTENIIKNNETRRLKSYIESGCINIHDAAQSTRALHASLSGLFDHLTKAQSLLIELERLMYESALVIETATKFSAQLDEDSSDELQHLTCYEENTNVALPQELEITEYGTLIAVVYSMVKQNYMMQEKIVRSLSLKSSSGELETYSLMWSLCPFVEDEIMNRAWKLIY